MDNSDLVMAACDMIQNAGILLRLPQTAMVTAQILLHRVYRTPDYTFDKYPLDITTMASLFLAAKIEEYPRKAREVMDVITYVISSKCQEDIKLSYKEHEQMREELITAERRLLKNLGFNLLSSYPHKMIVNYYHAIVHALDPENNVWRERDNQRLLQIAWNYCNDSLRTDAFLKFSIEAVACACIQLACLDTQMLFPKSTDGKHWYQLFVKNELDVSEIMKMIVDLYDRKLPHASELKKHLFLAKYCAK